MVEELSLSKLIANKGFFKLDGVVGRTLIVVLDVLVVIRFCAEFKKEVAIFHLNYGTL